MNDRFKFRAWNKTHKEMFNVYQIDYKLSLLYCESEKETTHTFGFCFCELEQCTGLKDRCGNLIYEGDVLHVNDECFYELLPDSLKTRDVVVVWCNEILQFILNPVNGSNISGTFDEFCVDEEFETIGNIHKI